MPPFLPHIAAIFLTCLSACAFSQATRTSAPLAESRPLLEPCQNRQTALWGLCRGDGSLAPPVVAQRFAFIGAGAEIFPARLGAADALGYIDSEGHWRMEPQYDRAYSPSEGIAVVSQAGRSAGLDSSGTPVVPWFDGLLYPSAQGLLCFVPAGRIEPGLLARLRQRLWGKPGDPPYPAPWWHIEGSAGFMDAAGKVVIEPRYEPKVNFVTGGCGFASSGFAAMRQNGKEGLIDRSGRWVIEPEYEYLGLVFSGNRKVVAMIAERMVEPGWFLDTVERLDGFMGPDGIVRWRETGPTRETPVAGGLGRTLLNHLLFPRWQQDLTNEDVSTRTLVAWTASLALGAIAWLFVLQPQGRQPGTARRLMGPVAALVTVPVVFIAGLLSVYASLALLATGVGLYARRRLRSPARPAAAP